MEIPEWRSEYTVGVPEIDRQHRYLFALGARLARSAESVDDAQELAYIVRELSQYANEHFVFEEQVMEKAGYEHLAYHKAMHEFMRTRLVLLKAQLDKGLLGRDELTEFMETWLTEHIIMEDMRYIPAVAAQYAQGGYP
jgi:hemerythrin